jgi:putative inorganic carbon (HCO3(-)) transporter
MAHTLSRSNAASAPLIVFAALLAGAAAVRSPQLAVGWTLLLLLFAVRSESRTAGLTLLWIFWLLTPLVRRVLDQLSSIQGADPLSLLPFVATALVAIMELRENRLSRRARSVLLAATCAFVLGVPVGLAIDPAATMFATVAYTAGLSAFVIGWGDQVRPGTDSTLERALRLALVPLALYGIAQYFYPLTSWDHHWVSVADIASVEAPQEGHIRAFSTLNSPFTYAITLSVGLMFALASRRRFLPTLLYVLPLVVALGLTFVRSAWLSLVIGLIVYAAAGKGRAAGKTVAIILVCLAGLMVVGSSNPTTKAFTDRITSLGDPDSDRSAKERLETTNRLLPQSLSQPLGAGMGQAGLAAGLSESGEGKVVEVDNGYLALLYQSGPLAFMLLLLAIGICVGAALRMVKRASPEERPYRAVVLGILVMLLVAESSADVLFGLPGVIFWYLGGQSLAGVSVGGAAAEPRAAVPRQPINVPSPGAAAP